MIEDQNTSWVPNPIPFRGLFERLRSPSFMNTIDIIFLSLPIISVWIEWHFIRYYRWIKEKSFVVLWIGGTLYQLYCNFAQFFIICHKFHFSKTKHWKLTDYIMNSSINYSYMSCSGGVDKQQKCCPKISFKFRQK